MKMRNCKSLTLAVGTCLMGGLAGYSIADTQQNPFVLSPLSSGYMVGQTDSQKAEKEGKCGEGKCGGGKAENEAVCGIYKVGSVHSDDSKVVDGKCGGHRPVEMLCGGAR